MLIDWFTVIAQAVNFLILVWLLKRFLYRPILAAIDAREKRIEAELADAAAKQSDALKERETYTHKNAEFDHQRTTLLNKALDEAKSERSKILDAARQEAEALHSKRQEAFRNEQQNLNEALTRRTRDEVFAITRKTLTDLADTTLEERMVGIFLRRLQVLDASEMAALKTAFAATTTPLLVRSTFSLPPAQRTAIENLLREYFGKDRKIQFEISDLISGIELSSNGHKVGWSIDEYLASLSLSIEALLKGQQEAEIKQATKQP